MCVYIPIHYMYSCNFPLVRYYVPTWNPIRRWLFDPQRQTLPRMTATEPYYSTSGNVWSWTRAIFYSQYVYI